MGAGLTGDWASGIEPAQFLVHDNQGPRAGVGIPRATVWADCISIMEQRDQGVWMAGVQAVQELLVVGVQRGCPFGAGGWGRR